MAQSFKFGKSYSRPDHGAAQNLTKPKNIRDLAQSNTGLNDPTTRGTPQATPTYAMSTIRGPSLTSESGYSTPASSYTFFANNTAQQQVPATSYTTSHHLGGETTNLESFAYDSNFHLPPTMQSQAFVQPSMPNSEWNHSNAGSSTLGGEHRLGSVTRRPSMLGQRPLNQQTTNPTVAFPLDNFTTNPNFKPSILWDPRKPTQDVRQLALLSTLHKKPILSNELYTRMDTRYPNEHVNRYPHIPAVQQENSDSRQQHGNWGSPLAQSFVPRHRPQPSYGTSLSSIWDDASTTTGPHSPATTVCYEQPVPEPEKPIKGKLEPGPGHGQAYIPMQTINENLPLFSGAAANLDQRRHIELQKEMKGISKGYGGDPFNPANQSANINDEENTALWMTNLPPDCNHQMLLSTIRDCGKVHACVVNEPDDATGGAHMTAAAKVVFFDQKGAQRLLRQAHQGLFKVGGFVPRVRHNRIKSAARTMGPQCRVLHIEGPPAIVNVEFLWEFFSGKFKFQVEEVLLLNESPQRVRQEWRFGSYRCQAEAARQSIHREKERFDLPADEKALWDQVNVHFGVDPCAP